MRSKKCAISVRNDLEGGNAERMVPRGGIEPPTQGFSVHDSKLKTL
jgi:hypothetical protein